MRFLFVFLLISGAPIGSQACPACPSSNSRLAFAVSNDQQQSQTKKNRVIATNMLLNPVAANLVAGSVAGAIGCGLAHPLDTLKTKAQLSTSSSSATTTTSGSQIAHYQPYSGTMSSNGLLSMEVALPLPATMMVENALTFDFEKAVETPVKPNMMQVASDLYQQEGLEGFLGGVQTMMIGQALIRAVCFATNAAVMDALAGSELDAFMILMAAGISAGVTSSFVVTPVERIKVLMQSNPNKYKDEVQCIQAVLNKEGLGGLLTRGLGISLLREVPSVGLSFILYASMMQMDAGLSMAPLLFGAISGSVSCVPVYPIDCVKTKIQNTEGGNDDSPIEIALDLYKNRGFSGFVDGLVPKMLRCAVLYAVSFAVYESILSILFSTPVAPY